MDPGPHPNPTKNGLQRSPIPDDSPGLYLHIPFCLRKCEYCGFYSITDLSLIPAWLSALRREMNLCSEGWSVPFDTLYIGGGTPSVLPAADLEGLIADLRALFTITADAEATVEINPGDATPDLLAALRRAGINRLNIGVQSFDDVSLALLGRRHTARQAIDAVHSARDAGFENIGLDLIFALPLLPAERVPTQAEVHEGAHPFPCTRNAAFPKTERNATAWFATLERAIGLNPDHISCYQLTLEAKTPLALRCRQGELLFPDESRQADLYFRTAEILEGTGYLHYEVSNFSRLGRESRHNRKYWRHSPYLGLGPAAHSFSGGERRWNRCSVRAYIDDLESGRFPVESAERLSDEQLRLEALFLGFRTSVGISLERFKNRYGLDLLTDKGKMIEKLLQEGLIENRDGFLRPTRAGMAVADSLALI